MDMVRGMVSQGKHWSLQEKCAGLGAHFFAHIEWNLAEDTVQGRLVRILLGLTELSA